MTAPARQAFWDSFLNGHECSVCKWVAIDTTLPDAERKRMAAALRTAHFSRIARNARMAARVARGGIAPRAAL